MNVLITDPHQIEAIRAITDRGYLVIPGERHYHDGNTSGAKRWPDGQWICAHDGCDPPYRHDVEEGEYGIVLPSPWCALPATCQTCDGKGHTGRSVGGGDIHLEACPDCWGDPVHLLQATCPHCRGYVADPEPEEVERHGPQVCDKCGTTGRVNLGRFTIQTVPVVDHHVKGWHVYISGGGRAYMVEPNERQVLLALDLLPMPGRDFVLEFVRQP